jgi:MFS family permease
MASRWRYEYTLLSVAFLANFSQLGARVVVSPMVPAIMDSFRITKGTIGLTLTLLWLAYALLQFPSGLLGDRFGERRVILAALFLTALSSFALAFAPSFLAFTLIAVCLGTGAGLYFPVATASLTKRFSNTGRALGIHAASGGVAGLVAPVGAAFVLVRYGWRTSLLAASGVVFAVFLVATVCLRPTAPASPHEPIRDRIRLAAVVALLQRPSIAYTLLLATIGAFSFQAFGSFFPTFLVEYWGLSTEAASVRYSVVFLVNTVGIAVMGNLSDSFSRDAVIGVCFCCLLAAFGLAVAATEAVATTVAVGLFGVGLSWPAAVQSRFMDHLSSAERNTAFGLVRTVQLSISATGSVVVGVLADAFGWQVAFGCLVAILSVAVLSVVLNAVFGGEL